MKLTLVRDYRGEDCTMGVLSLSTPSEDFSCQTMERPWRPVRDSKGGMKGMSCVPLGTYKLERHNSEAHPQTWALVNPELDVWHWEDALRPTCRSLVLIHVANWPTELRGCIAPGRGRAKDEFGRNMVTSSRLAMIELKRLLPWDDLSTLEIRNA